MTALKQRLKHLAGVLVFRTGLYRWLFRGRALIVLFHRIDDRYPGNPITSTTDVFDSFCRFFARYFKVVPLADLIDSIENGQDVSGHLAITFDDGYRDNHDAAAPILRSHDLHATFFISTGFIGTTRIPWWDKRWGVESQWMTWDEVKALARDFQVEPHTVNHVDLGEVGGSEARQEILASKEKLEEVLGGDHAIFSYPYGGRDQMAEENRDIVRRSGFRCCLSAYGGSVRPGDDLFDLKRVPISTWFGTPYQFGLEAALDRA